MNKLTIIGNLTRDPELRVTSDGVYVCDFTVAVNRRRSRGNDAPEADFFKATVWRENAENCNKYLKKGSKVCVIGPVSVQLYTGNDGVTRANLEVTAQEVEFISSGGESHATTEQSHSNAGQAPVSSGYTQVYTDELPF